MSIDFDLITVIIGIAIYLIWCWFIYKKYHKGKVYYIYSTIMFIYFLALIKVTLFPIMMIGGMPSNINANVNFIPFADGIGRTDILNLIMTIPFGIGMPFVSKINSLAKSAISGVILGTCIELIQYLETLLTGGFTLRTIDINDVIFNALGTVVGFVFLYVISQVVISRIKGSKFNLSPFWAYAYEVCRKIKL